MADFCKECSIRILGRDYRDLAGLCKPGEVAYDICEDCGFIAIDHTGRKLTAEELEAYEKNTVAGQAVDLPIDPLS